MLTALLDSDVLIDKEQQFFLHGTGNFASSTEEAVGNLTSKNTLVDEKTTQDLDKDEEKDWEKEAWGLIDTIYGLMQFQETIFPHIKVTSLDNDLVFCPYNIIQSLILIFFLLFYDWIE